MNVHVFRRKISFSGNHKNYTFMVHFSVYTKNFYVRFTLIKGGRTRKMIIRSYNYLLIRGSWANLELLAHLIFTVLKNAII